MPSGLLVHVAGGGDSPPFSVELAPGDRVRFGRGAPGVPVDVRLDNPAVPRLAGEVEATEDFWRLSNFSGAQSLLVENPEGAGEYFRVAPRRVGAPVPFEFARVVLPARGPTAVSFQVYAPVTSTPSRPWAGRRPGRAPWRRSPWTRAPRTSWC